MFKLKTVAKISFYFDKYFISEASADVKGLIVLLFQSKLDVY